MSKFKVNDNVKAAEDIPSNDGNRVIDKGTRGTVTRITPVLEVHVVSFNGFNTEVRVVESQLARA